MKFLLALFLCATPVKAQILTSTATPFGQKLAYLQLQGQVKALTSGKPTITGQPIYQGGICFADTSCQFTAGLTTTSTLGWSQITGFPTGCTLPNVVTTVGTTLTCQEPSNVTGTANTITGSITESQVTNLTTDLAGKVSKTGDTMTGPLILNGSSLTITTSNLVLGTTSSSIYIGTYPFINLNTSQIGTDGQNLFFGFNAGTNTLSNFSNGGSGNIGIGTNVMSNCTAAGGPPSCIENVGLGIFAMTSNTSGWENVAVGYEAMFSNTSGDQNNAQGGLAMAFNTTGSSNSALGNSAMYGNTTGGNDTAIGWSAMGANPPTTNDACTAIGSNAMFSGTFDQQNVAIGYAAEFSGLTTSADVAVGRDALFNSLIGANTAIGHKSLRSTTNGIVNTALGYQSGETDIPANANVNGSSNTYIGGYAGAGTSATINNSTALGYLAKVTASNTLVLGSTSPATQIAIGTTSALSGTLVDIKVATNHHWAFQDGSGAPQIVSFNDAKGTVLGQIDAAPLALNAGSGQKVGINTLTPATQLDVNGNAQFGSGVNKSTFSTTGALTMASGAQITGNVTGNLTGTASNVTTNANLTGPVTSVGNATTIAGPVPQAAVNLSTVTTAFTTKASSGTNADLSQFNGTGGAITISTSATVTSSFTVLGNLGAGTSAAAGPFDVEASGNFSTFIGTQTSPGVIYNRQLIVGGNAGSGGVFVTGAASNTGGFGFLQSMTRGSEIQGLRDGDNTHTGLLVLTSNGTPVNVTAMTIKGNGNVGIGITPTSALSVQGIATSSTTTPTVSCTAGSPAMTVGSTSQAGSYTAGALATGCTVSFATTFPKAPFCLCQASANLVVWASATATNSLTCTSATAMTGDTINYFCWGPP